MKNRQGKSVAAVHNVYKKRGSINSNMGLQFSKAMAVVGIEEEAHALILAGKDHDRVHQLKRRHMVEMSNLRLMQEANR